ncbi:ComEA family DNA-binding protein [Algoriphagus machipongonensis]|uniref:Helix-hairpin-helix domain-containing protein n=1 Tax=Algoriphagus machipongonensis TaxID=388413 RepID=A3I0I0_9BACT|nr:helix-hairpin-helix domain-containing protein [Algoriphagus machipongonensis]EAZ79976.1 hypothetical protein ALPR1_15144 [Algoriphagus machipongonensis]
MEVKYWKIALLLILNLQTLLLWSQTPPKPEIDPETFIERLFPVQDEDLDYESIYEVLFQLYQNPININLANAEVLQATYLLTPTQISSLINYREKYGPLLSLYELQAVPNFDSFTIQQILPFVILGKEGNTSGKKFLKRIIDEEQAYVLVRHRMVWETRKGFTAPDTAKNGNLSSRYLGDPNDLYLRLRIQHSRDFSLGITLDKDAGEQFTWDSKTRRFGFNFFSYHFTKYSLGNWKVINLGDYQVQFGQGLVFGAGYSLGKGSETVPTVKKSSIGILPYTAAMEFGFFRGAAATYQEGNWQASIMSSLAPRDGRSSSMLDSLENEVEIISSLGQSGLHRTKSELSTKNQFRELNLGGNFQYSLSNKFQIGSNFLWTKFDQIWIKSPTPYNQFDFSGKTNWVSSVYFNYNWKNFFLFGETGMSKSGGNGSVFGFISSLSKEVGFSLVWRNYDRNFHSFYANVFSEGTRPMNERGLYLGIEIKPKTKWKVNAYYDYFKFPWLRYRSYSPSSGYEWLSRITFQPSKTLKTFIQVRQEQKDRNIADNGSPSLLYQTKPLNKINSLISLEYQISPQVFIRSRILASRVDYDGEKSYGYMFLQDLRYGNETWKLTGRVALFDTDNYDNRQYAFENNVLWTFSIPAFSGQGMRYYLIGQYDVNSQLTAYLRFARTNYTDRESISSGLQMIEKPHQTETTFLLRYMLHR